MRDEVNTNSIKKDVDISRTGSRKCECPFRLRGKPVKGGQWWMVELICGSHNHDLAETMVGQPYVGRSSVDNDVTPEDELALLRGHVHLRVPVQDAHPPPY